MKASSDSPAPVVLEALRRRAAGRRALTFAEFVSVALYDPLAGYYARDRPRVGYAEGTDFLTATASAPLFGRLVAEACVHLLGAADPAAYAFVELGAEAGGGVLAGLAHPFSSARTVRYGEPIVIEGPAVVFSNELFDAQPFRRFRHRGGAWRELGVALGDGALAEVEMEPTPALAALPEGVCEGYVIDAPTGASALAGAIAAQPWHGLFLAFDYGKPWEEIAHATPSGTARAYRRHTQTNDLLAHAGDQDLTCHVCWDWLVSALRERGFPGPQLCSQEAFFVRHAGGLIRSAMTASAAGLDRDKLSLLQLLHPANLGQRFQALWALRPEAAGSGKNPLA